MLTAVRRGHEADAGGIRRRQTIVQDVMRSPVWSLMTSALLALGVGCAQAGPCSADIAKIEKALNAPNSPFGPTGRQTVGAQLGRQPTPASMARAEQKAGSHYQAALTQAQTLDNQNNPACKKAVKKLKALVGM